MTSKQDPALAVAPRQKSMLARPEDYNMYLLGREIDKWTRNRATRALLIELTEEEKQELHECFDILDEDRSGTLWCFCSH